MKIAAWLLEPLHWVKVTVAAVAWVLLAPTLWELLRTVATAPGGGGVLFGLIGFVVVVTLACRRGRSRREQVTDFSMTVAEMVNQIRRTPQQLAHAARHEAAHAVLASGATEQARQVLVRHEPLVAAIAAPLVAHQDAQWLEPDLTGLQQELTGSRELVPS